LGARELELEQPGRVGRDADLVLGVGLRGPAPTTAGGSARPGRAAALLACDACHVGRDRVSVGARYQLGWHDPALGNLDLIPDDALDRVPAESVGDVLLEGVV